ncbi:MAG: nucleoside hydrolase [Bacteroidota bacterium]
MRREQSRGACADGDPTRIPLIHTTDLYHPPQDPDDHIDLATAAALPEYDLKAVILDPTEKYLSEKLSRGLVRRKPGFRAVTSLAEILARSIPVAAGPMQPLKSPIDDIADRPATEQSGIRLLLETLEESNEKVVISVVGSARILAAAFNRSPGLVRSKVSSVLLNAGSLAGPKKEWNVDLDPHAYICLWNSGLPIRWYPCATERGSSDPNHEHGTYWHTSHAAIFKSLSRGFRGWFTEEFSAGLNDERRDSTNAQRSWERILNEERNMWSTASLVMAAGRVLARMSEGWRFIPSEAVGGERVWQWELEPIAATVNADAIVEWKPAREGGVALLFRRELGAEYATAMSEALCALLGTIPDKPGD